MARIFFSHEELLPQSKLNKSVNSKANKHSIQFASCMSASCEFISNRTVNILSTVRQHRSDKSDYHARTNRTKQHFHSQIRTRASKRNILLNEYRIVCLLPRFQ